eukprot:1154863-Pelagomonas_calceolata.AAC.1
MNGVTPSACFRGRCLTRKEERKKNYACQVWPRALRKGQLKGGPHHTDQEEEVAQKSTPASWPPPWGLRHDCQ